MQQQNTTTDGRCSLSPEQREAVKADIYKALDQLDDYYLRATAAFVKKLAEDTGK